MYIGKYLTHLFVHEAVQEHLVHELPVLGQQEPRRHLKQIHSSRRGGGGGYVSHAKRTKRKRHTQDPERRHIKFSMRPTYKTSALEGCSPLTPTTQPYICASHVNHSPLRMASHPTQPNSSHAQQPSPTLLPQIFSSQTICDTPHSNKAKVGGCTFACVLRGRATNYMRHPSF